MFFNVLPINFYLATKMKLSSKIHAQLHKVFKSIAVKDQPRSKSQTRMNCYFVFTKYQLQFTIKYLFSIQNKSTALKNKNSRSSRRGAHTLHFLPFPTSQAEIKTFSSLLRGASYFELRTLKVFSLKMCFRKFLRCKLPGENSFTDFLFCSSLLAGEITLVASWK